jgi:hypothetical protein
MNDLTREMLNVLAVVAAVCSLVLFTGVVVSLAVGLFRVVALGRVLVLPFRDADPGRAALTALFMQRLNGDGGGVDIRRPRSGRPPPAVRESQS